MDYGKLGKEELISLCEERNIPCTSSWTKMQLEELIIKNDLAKKDIKQINTIGKVGAYYTIVICSMLLPILIIFSIILIGIPFLVFDFVTLTLNILFLNGKVSKLLAGIFGVFFAGLIGGILVVVSEEE